MKNEENLQRRNFLKKTGILISSGFALPLLSPLMNACDSIPNKHNDSPIKYEIDINKYPGLSIPETVVRCKAHKIANTNKYIVVIVRVLPNHQFIVVQSNCTHQKDQILPANNNKEHNIICPRHQTVFSLNTDSAGRIVANPNNIETEPLKEYNYEYKKDENKIVLLLNS